jgi:hypothetical protein
MSEVVKTMTHQAFIHGHGDTIESGVDLIFNGKSYRFSMEQIDALIFGLSEVSQAVEADTLVALALSSLGVEGPAVHNVVQRMHAIKERLDEEAEKEHEKAHKREQVGEWFKIMPDDISDS